MKQRKKKCFDAYWTKAKWNSSEVGVELSELTFSASVTSSVKYGFISLLFSSNAKKKTNSDLKGREREQCYSFSIIWSFPKTLKSVIQQWKKLFQKCKTGRQLSIFPQLKKFILRPDWCACRNWYGWINFVFG